MNEKQKSMIGLMKEILQEDYVAFSVKNYSISEQLNNASLCRLNACLINADGSDFVVEGEGVGSIDALFNGLIKRLADEYPSVRSISFSQFEIKALLTTDKSSKAEAEAVVGALNSEGKEFIFCSTAPSISRAGIEAVVQVAEYFVNSEKTFLKLKSILQHYRETGRTDLVEKYTDLMSRVVENTSYSGISELKKQQEEN